MEQKARLDAEAIGQPQLGGGVPLAGEAAEVGVRMVEERGVHGGDWVLAAASFIPGLGVLCALVCAVQGGRKRGRAGVALVAVAATGAVTGCLATLLVARAFFLGGFTFPGEPGRDRVLAEASRDNLRRTVVELEYFRLVHGTYPPELDALKNGRPAHYLQDVSAGLRLAHERLHVYEPTPDGRHYRLLDRGPDAVSSTADDLYPDLAPEEWAKVGALPPPVH